jgi:hypothetical protein
VVSEYKDWNGFAKVRSAPEFSQFLYPPLGEIRAIVPIYSADTIARPLRSRLSELAGFA